MSEDKKLPPLSWTHAAAAVLGCLFGPQAIEIVRNFAAAVVQ